MEGLAEVQRPEKLTLARRAVSVSHVARTMECGWAPGRGAFLGMF